jgi:uncharacterized protein YndB with AHSA1/START domain
MNKKQRTAKANAYARVWQPILQTFSNCQTHALLLNQTFHANASQIPNSSLVTFSKKLRNICVTLKLQIMQNEIKQSWYFNQSQQVVWEYLTKPELLEKWLAKSDFQPLVGHKFRFIGPHGSEIYGEVLEVKPFTLFSYSWQRTSAKDNKLFISKVVWTLVPKENGRELQLVHNGFIALEDYVAHNNGWTIIGTRFVELLKTIKK